MTVEHFRKLALSLPEVQESSHMGHPDFRVAGKIFATLGHPAAGWGMVKLKPQEQQRFVEDAPDAFQPVKGGWGERGATSVCLKAAKEGIVRNALVAAWRNTAPKRLAIQVEEE
ncbi:MAG TPA: MmcQ/YjbR family DNA-binding protein [Tepidisphaeraceae bacterium]